jgi:excinuclease ABC subunit C
LLPKGVPEKALEEQRLTDLKGKKVQIVVPVKGEKRHLLQMACENAKKSLLSDAEFERDQKKILEALREKLHLRSIPRRIEAFDISNFQGGHAVGSMVFFEDGRPNKEGYRHFKIKTVEGADDYGMMYEVLLRRYQKAVVKNDLPDLVLLDGGRGQLNVAQEVFKELQVKEIDLISLAKEKTKGGTLKAEEKIFHPQYKEPFHLGRQSPLLHFLDRVRDEAHRFAITYHKKVRSKETVKSVIGDIPGIGKVRQRELLKHFGSVEAIKKASVNDLEKTPKMDKKLAQKVYAFFRNTGK